MKSLSFLCTFLKKREASQPPVNYRLFSIASTVIKHVYLREVANIVSVRLAFGLIVAFTCVTNPKGGAPATNFKTPMPPMTFLQQYDGIFSNIRRLNRVNLQYKKGKITYRGENPKEKNQYSAGNKKHHGYIILNCRMVCSVFPLDILKLRLLL